MKTRRMPQEIFRIYSSHENNSLHRKLMQMTWLESATLSQTVFSSIPHANPYAISNPYCKAMVILQLRIVHKLAEVFQNAIASGYIYQVRIYPP